MHSPVIRHSGSLYWNLRIVYINRGCRVQETLFPARYLSNICKIRLFSDYICQRVDRVVRVCCADQRFVFITMKPWLVRHLWCLMRIVLFFSHTVGRSTLQPFVLDGRPFFPYVCWRATFIAKVRSLTLSTISNRI